MKLIRDVNSDIHAYDVQSSQGLSFGLLIEEPSTDEYNLWVRGENLKTIRGEYVRKSFNDKETKNLVLYMIEDALYDLIYNINK